MARNTKITDLPYFPGMRLALLLQKEGVKIMGAKMEHYTPATDIMFLALCNILVETHGADRIIEELERKHGA